MTLRSLLRISTVVTTSRCNRYYNHSIKMNNAYFRHVEGAEHFQISFQYRNETFGIDRQFNFSRQLSEKVNDFVGRITANIERNLTKKKRKNKGANTELEELNKVQVQLLRNGEPISGDEVCKDILFVEGVALSVNDTQYSLIVNAPWISLVTLPVSIMVGFPVYPLKLDIMFAKKEDCKFTWYKNNGKPINKNQQNNWIEIGAEYYYTPRNSDIGCRLKLCCVPQRDGIQGLPFEIISSNPVEAGPGHCPFELRHAFTTKRLPSSSFRVVSYNILADLYADSDVARNCLFPYCPPYALCIDYRKQLILKELLGYNADLICLQEVDSKVFDIDLLPILSSVGYDGVFNKKAGQVSEGLACLFYKSKFRYVSSHSIILGEEIQVNPIFSNIWNKIKDNGQLVSRVVGRTTCSQVVVLDSVDNPAERIVVGNTHQYFHPEADHIRLLQAGITITFLEHVMAETSAKDPGKCVSCILCGDFNSTPEFGVYQLITTQNVPEDHIDWSSNKEEEVKGVSLTHSLPLVSAYGTPEFTNYTSGFAGCLDYIFYNQEHLAVEQIVPQSSEEEMKQHVALPSVVFPSDHVALVADLSWKKALADR